MLSETTLPSPVGALTLVASDAGLRAVLWPDDDARRVPLAVRGLAAAHPVLERAADELADYFAGRRGVFTVPLDPAGTGFQQQVWAALRAIPPGETRSYRAVAVAIGRPAATRAVGAANGRNPLSIIIPCHRVVGSDGRLTGFAGGLAAKRWLLDHERRMTGTDAPRLL